MSIHSVTNWSLDFRKDGIFIIEGIQTIKKQYLGNHKWHSPSGSMYRQWQRTKVYGPMTIKNLRQWKKSPYCNDIEATVPGRKETFILVGRNHAGTGCYDKLKELYNVKK